MCAVLSTYTRWGEYLLIVSLCLLIVWQLLFFFSVPNQQHKATMHGPRGGLSIVLKFPDYEQPLSNTLHSTFSEMGFKVFVHNNMEFPNEETGGKLTTVNREYYISVRPRQIVCSDQVQQLKIEDRDCVFSEERPSPFFPGYSEVNCQIECRMNKIHELCGCMPYTFFPVENVDVCNFTKIPCITNIWGKCLCSLITRQLAISFPRSSHVGDDRL